MSEQEDKQKELARRLQQMVSVTKFEDKDNEQRKLASQFMEMMNVTKETDADMKKKELARQFAEMMEQTKSFDVEREELQKAGETAISNAFKKMIDLSYQLEHENEKAADFEREEKFAAFKHPPGVNIEDFPTIGDKFFHLLVSKLPPRIRKFPRAFRRNPKAVTKYFLAMIVGRILAITLYVLAAFIPAIPVPDSVTGVVGRAPSFLGGALSSMRGFVTEFSPQAVMTTVTNIPTDINKILQKIGEFFQYYGRRTAGFTVRAIRNPKLAFEDCCSFFKRNASLLLRILKGACGVAFSLAMIKLSMIFLLPLFGGIAITVLGFKISIILIVVVRMAVSTISEVIGNLIGGKLLRFFKNLRKHPEKVSDLIKDMLNEGEKNIK